MVLDIEKRYVSIQVLSFFSNFLFAHFFTREKITNYFLGSCFFEELSERMSRIACGDNVVYEEHFFIFESLFKGLLKRVFVSYHGSLVFISS